MSRAVLWAACGTGFTFLMTAAGAAVVFFFKGNMKENVQRVFLGFAAGVMIAASVWSLLIPSIDQAQDRNYAVAWIPAAGGFVLGGLFLLAVDKLLPHLHLDSEKPEGIPSSLKRVTLLISAVTLHNIPEGMATGLAFALAAQNPGEKGLYAAAFALAIGIGIQNFPEGAAISLPLRKEGVGRGKAFLWGAASGVVEPVFGVLTTLVAGMIQPVMPWLLAFAAGAMIYVVVEELIPEAKFKTDSHAGTIGFMAGFLIMMILDVALG